MQYMDLAIELAKKTKGEIPVGAVIVKNNKIIATSFNSKELDKKITSHAEIIAIEKASKILNNWRLNDCDIYVTLEPCPMCGWAILQARIKNIYFGSYDLKYGAFSKSDLCSISDFKPNIYGGIKEIECDLLLNNFFESIRSK